MRRGHFIIAIILFAILTAAAALSQSGHQQLLPAAPGATPVPLDPFSTGPSYDSGWRSITKGQTISMWHGLGAPPAMLLVHLQTRKNSSPRAIDQRFVGGNDLGTASAEFGNAEARVGTYWHNLTINSLLVTRMPEDAGLDSVRVRIWRMSDGADWSSGWLTLNAGFNWMLHHDLGGDPYDYMVDLMFNDMAGSGLGVNQRAYGGRDLGSLNQFMDNNQVGGFWHLLQSTSINIYRQPDDEYADQMLVRIWKKPQRATYDSGWYTIDKGALHTFTHNIGGSAEDYIVRMEFKSTDTSSGIGINHCYYGGNDAGTQKGYFMNLWENDRVGAYWFNLDGDSIAVRRRQEDRNADQIRIRIWNFWTPTRPYFDSDWKAVSTGELKLLSRDINIDPNDMLVDLQFKDSGLFSFGMHQRGMGGMDWTNGDRLGGYWIFNSGAIQVFRRAEDTDAGYFRARIWRMPKPAYDSGWHDISSESGHPFTHALGGTPADYLVDLQFKTNLGSYHQIGYGGYHATHIDAKLGDRTGGLWESLDDTQIVVARLPEDSNITNVRVRIWNLALPAYDSGMVTPTTVSTTLQHNIDRNPEDYFVNLVFNGSGATKLHQVYYGGCVLSSQALPPQVAGDAVGAFWRRLTGTAVEVYRQPQDTYVDQFRMRLWLLPYKNYLPVMRK